MGKLVSTERNTYENAGSVAQIVLKMLVALHRLSDKSKVSFPLLSFLYSNDFMETAVTQKVSRTHRRLDSLGTAL